MANKKLVRFVIPGPLENEVGIFSKAMLAQLHAHEFVGNWSDWKPSVEELELAMSKAWIQLKQAKAEANFDRVQELAADLGNYAEKAFMLYGKK